MLSPREHNGFSTTFQSSLKTWDEIGVQNSANYPNNYALELTSGQSITHNRFVVPDWGTLRFDLHVPNASDGSEFKVSIKSPESDAWIPLGAEIDLTPVENDLFDNDNNVGYYDYYPEFGYVDPYTYRIDYGQEGFETFHLDVPKEWRNKAALLKFEVEGNSTVYLDNVFFKSEHIILGNPSNARTQNSDEYRQNYLTEYPGFTVSYNSRVPGVNGDDPNNWGGGDGLNENGINGPNWVSWQLNKSWLGNFSRPREFPGFERPTVIPNYPPLGEFGNYSATKNREDYPWVSELPLLR